MSLAALLCLQPELEVSHELGGTRILPWDCDWAAWDEAMQWIRLREIDGDVAHFWLTYLPRMLEANTGLVAICLRRDVDETVRSLIRSSGAKNQFSEVLAVGETRTGRAVCFPKYPLPKEEAARAYWCEYYDRAEALARRFPSRFRIFDTEDLNTTSGQREILRFAGVRQPVFREGLRLNTTPAQGLGACDNVTPEEKAA